MDQSLFSSFSPLFSASICFRSCLVCEISFTGESTSRKLSYLEVIWDNSFFVTSFSTSRPIIFLLSSEIISFSRPLWGDDKPGSFISGILLSLSTSFFNSMFSNLSCSSSTISCCSFLSISVILVRIGLKLGFCSSVASFKIWYFSPRSIVLWVKNSFSRVIFSIFVLTSSFSCDFNKISSFLSSDSQIFFFKSVFSSLKALSLSSFCLIILRIWDISFTGESMSLRFSYFSLISLRDDLRSSFSILQDSSNSIFSFNKRFSPFNSLTIVSFCFANFLIWEYSFTGESTSLRLSYFWVIAS